MKFVQEKRLISKFFDEISQDTGKFVFGVADTLACLEMGAVETLIVWESLDVNRYTLMNTVTGATETKVSFFLYIVFFVGVRERQEPEKSSPALLPNTKKQKTQQVMTKDQEALPDAFKDEATGAELEVQSKTSLLEWLADSYKKFGCQLEFVTNKSQEGSQFCRGFGGIGGLLRYAVDLTQFEGALDDDDGPVWDSDEDI